MEVAAHGTALLAAISLGLSAGALVAEGSVLVPFWRGMQPEAFLAWYRKHADLLLRFFGPLEIASTSLALGALGLGWFARSPAVPLLGAAAGCCVGVLAAFPVYFQRANAAFASASIELAHVEVELLRWARWHWARTALAMVGFVCALLSLSSWAGRS